MKSLGRKVFVASLSVLLLLATSSVLLSLELSRWNAETAYVMRDYRRAILDSEFHETLLHVTSDTANYLQSGFDEYRTEANEGLGRARQAAASLRAVHGQGPVEMGDASHAKFLAKQQLLLDSTEAKVEAVFSGSFAPGAEGTADGLSSLHDSESQAKALWQEIVGHHRLERLENERALQDHSHRVAVLGIGSAGSFLVWLTLLIAYVRRRVVDPLKTLSRLTTFVAAGDLTRRAAVTHSDEIGQLQSSFNQMVVELADQRRQLAALVERLSRSRDAAEAANRAKTEFLANVSHEVRTPMNGVLITLDLMYESAPCPEQRDLADMARVSARSLLAMLNDLLDSSRIESGKLELASIVFEPQHLVRQMIKLHGTHATSKDLSIDCEFGAAVPAELRGDPMRLGQILLNLLDNAIKFTQSGSIVVSVAVDEADHPPSMAPGSIDEAEAPVWLRFRVTDSGVGVPLEAAERIFEPFYQAEGSTLRTNRGIGLGLSIARQLARAMGGELGFESEPGRGSSFWFTARLLPDLKGCVAAAGAPPMPLRQLPAGCAVLLVEDHRPTREVMARMLERRGLRVVTAENGHDALALVAGENFDVILMDCRMPGMDGFQAARAIRWLGDDRANVPIVALTAYALTGKENLYTDAGFDDFVAKPYRVEEIDAVLYRWLVEQRRGGPASRQDRSAEAKVRRAAAER
jgi:signal transduction histidine kinase/FixJ family two-component response regulator